MAWLEKLRAFLNIKPEKTELADHIRKKAYEQERIKLAEIEGKEKAKLESKRYMEKLEAQKHENQGIKRNWRGTLQSLSDAIDNTFKPSTPQQPIKKTKEHDGISPTFRL